MKRFLILWIACMSCTHAFAWTLQSTNQYQLNFGGAGFTDNYTVDNVMASAGDTIIVSETFTSSLGMIHIDNATPTLIYSNNIDNPNGGGSVGFRVFAYKVTTSGSKNILLEYAQNGSPFIIQSAVVSGLKDPSLPFSNAYSETITSSVTSITQNLPAISPNAFGFWVFTAQSGASVGSGNAWTIVDHQPEVIAFGTGLAHNAYGYNAINLDLTLNSSSQLFRGLLVAFEPESGGGGGGGGGTTTQDYIYTNGSISTNDIFTMGSSTVTFGTIDYTACDVTSITVNPFASSSLSWGTFNIPSCILQSFKLLLFGSNGFDTYNLTNFVNSSSSTLPFLMFKFMGGALVYINPVTGGLINLPNATSSFVYSIPLFSTSSPTLLDINASSSIISKISLPESVDKIAATIEIALFFLIWAIIFRYINI